MLRTIKFLFFFFLDVAEAKEKKDHTEREGAIDSKSKERDTKFGDTKFGDKV